MYCLALKKEFPDLIAGSCHTLHPPAEGARIVFFSLVGFDLVGPEDTTKPIIDYLIPLLRFVDRQKELGLEIPFVFHAGETLDDGTAVDDNLYDAIYFARNQANRSRVRVFRLVAIYLVWVSDLVFRLGIKGSR